MLLPDRFSVLFVALGLSLPAFAQQSPRFAVVRAPASRLAEIRVKVGEKSFRLKADEHSPGLKNDSIQSNMLFIPSTGEVELVPAGAGRLILIEPGVSPDITPQENRSVRSDTVVGCPAPTAVPQSTWRAGMAAPMVPPDTNVVRHLIVHHSAIDSAGTDYTAQVRAIYILHTQTNGYDDIGYNYLIAPDGALFTGRDPQGRCRQDNVKGAHMCAKNAATMGVCLLGDFTARTPQPAAMATLEVLLGWKLAVERMSAYDSSLHPPGSATAMMLGALVGHRDGCGGVSYTQCPGDSVYARLGQARAEADSLRHACLRVTAGQAPIGDVIHVASTGAGRLEISQGPPQAAWALWSLDGREVANGNVKADGKTEASGLRPGLFLFRVEGLAVRRVVIQ